MAGVLNIVRSLTRHNKRINFLKNHRSLENGSPKRFKVTSAAPKAKRANLKILLTATAAGGTIGAVYSYFKKDELDKAILNTEADGLPVIWKELPKLRISREVVHPNKDLDVVLFQYPTCPFCCKVRAFLDYFGISYKIVEVNPIKKTELKWSEYRKVPTLLVKVEGGYMQLNDSSVIISVLRSYLYDDTTNLTDVVKFYPNIAYLDDDGKIKKEVMNRYHVMYQGDLPPKATKESIASERSWRKWADDILMHMVSPNVYRTLEEAKESFEWYSEIGEWDKNFTPWEVGSIKFFGSTVMWLLGKKIHKKYNLKPDARESLYDSCNNWLKIVKTKGAVFHGGQSPDLADLSVYGILNSMEGCSAFADLRKNTKISAWYDAVKIAINRHDGFYVR